ncbi:MAG: outer membrane protein assembly factor BamB [Pseudoalteromonas tetraodonis]|jgi:outer membrane protein assembly factor BamB
MRPLSIFLLAPSILIILGSSLGAAENWPGWRGPRGDGSTENDPRIPTDWSMSKDVVWKTPLPGKGHASPIIWEDRIFTVAALKGSQERVLICIDRPSGKILWQKTVLKSPVERIHKLNSLASSTPVTDGECVYVSFLDENEMFIAAYNFAGKKLWERRPGIFSSVHGYCSSPILWKEKLIINGDHDGEAYLIALDRANGKTIWKTPRPNKTRSYCTPIIREIDGRTQMILSGSKSVASYDPDSGEQHWIIDGPTEQFVASLVYNGELLFMTCGFPERHMLAIKPDGKGNVTDSHIVWRTTRSASYVPSPVAIGEYFLVVSDGGVSSCFLADNGDSMWNERLPRRHSASAIAANGLAYFLSDQGVMSVIRPGEDFDLVAQSELGEECNASPAVYDGKFYIRGDKHLFCIGAE